jgi:hypothetical protein
VLIQGWGKKFERDHDILPLFSDVYNALKRKGIEFPDASGSSPSKFDSPAKVSGNSG